MSEEAVKETEETAELAAKPTITIAEREGATAEAAKPTITIAEREGGEETMEASSATSAASNEETKEPEDVHYQAVEKDGNVTAIWEMQGQRHLRTIDPRSSEGKQILALFETAG